MTRFSCRIGTRTAPPGASSISQTVGCGLHLTRQVITGQKGRQEMIDRALAHTPIKLRVPGFTIDAQQGPALAVLAELGAELLPELASCRAMI